MDVPFYRHSLTSTDAGAIGDVLQSPFLTSGPVGRQVEAELSAFFGANHAVLTSSWTAGAMALLLALDIGPGDEVIVPAMTFVATANVAELLGARAVFVDVEPGTLLMTCEGVERALTSRTRAVIPVHLYGQMCDMTALGALLASRPEIALIEDAAHCFEGSRIGLKPGAGSTAAIFSFYATKNVTCGEGGAVVLNDPALHERLLQTRNHGMSAAAISRYENNRYRPWELERLGIKGNLPDLLAALLPAQIATIRARLPHRQRLAQRYREAFADGPVALPTSHPECEHAEHLFAIHVPALVRDRAVSVLNELGIGVAVHYNSVPTTRFYAAKYGYRAADHPVSAEWGAGEISLPLYESLTLAEQDAVIAAVQTQVYPLLLNQDAHRFQSVQTL